MPKIAETVVERGCRMLSIHLSKCAKNSLFLNVDNNSDHFSSSYVAWTSKYRVLLPQTLLLHR